MNTSLGSLRYHTTGPFEISKQNPSFPWISSARPHLCAAALYWRERAKQQPHPSLIKTAFHGHWGNIADTKQKGQAKAFCLSFMATVLLRGDLMLHWLILIHWDCTFSMSRSLVCILKIHSSFWSLSYIILSGYFIWKLWAYTSYVIFFFFKIRLTLVSFSFCFLACLFCAL